MKTDLDKMTLKELKDLKKQVDKAISSYESRKKQEALAALEAKAQDLGYSLGDLVSDVAPRKRRPAKAKYMNPSDTSETWSGRGRRPRWVEAALKSGKSLDDISL